MTRLLAIAGIGLSLVFALLVVGLRWQAQDEAVEALFGHCSLPCWQAVQPGTTARGDALTKLRERGWAYYAECNAAVYDVCYIFVEGDPSQSAYVYVEQEQVVQIALLFPHLTLGEILLAFGVPDYAAIPPNTAPAAAFFTAFWFGGARVSARMSAPCPAQYAELLRTPVNTMLVWAPGTAMRVDTLGTMTDVRDTLRAVCSV